MSLDKCVECGKFVDTDYDCGAYTLISEDCDEVDVLACHCDDCRYFDEKDEILKYCKLNNIEVMSC